MQWKQRLLREDRGRTKLQGLYFARKKLYKSMASKPGILTEWPWTFLGNFKVLFNFFNSPTNFFPLFFSYV